MRETYLNLLRRVWRLIFSPASEWNVIKTEQKTWERVEKEYLLPLWSLLICSMLVRIGYLFFFVEYEYSKSTFSADCIETVAATLNIIVCFYVAVLIRSKADKWYSQHPKVYIIPLRVNRDLDFTSQYLAYCSTLMVVTQVVESFIPVAEVFYWPVNMYAAYIFWTCYWALCHNEKSSFEPQPLHFTAMTFVLVYGLPMGLLGVVKMIIKFALQ